MYDVCVLKCIVLIVMWRIYVRYFYWLNDNVIEKFKKYFILNFWGFKYVGVIIKIDCYFVCC